MVTLPTALVAAGSSKVGAWNEKKRKIEAKKSAIQNQKTKLNRIRQQTVYTKNAVNMLSGSLDEMVNFLDVEVSAVERWGASVKTVEGSLEVKTQEQLKEIIEFHPAFGAQLVQLEVAAQPLTVLDEQSTGMVLVIKKSTFHHFLLGTHFLPFNRKTMVSV